MSRKTFNCPQCNTTITLQGRPGEVKQITCKKCGFQGQARFPEEGLPKPSAHHSPAITVVALTKHYGKLRATDNLSFTVNKGEIFGFLGPNGAGKTTTIRCMLDYLYSDMGTITIFGLNSHHDTIAIRKRTGYLPGDFTLPPNMTVKTYLSYMLELSECSNPNKMKRLANNLDLDISKKTHELSKGNKQKVGIVQAFMANQDLIILDEPTAGLDPLIQQQFYRILRNEQKLGKTVFMSSHVLSEVEAVCDRVALINNGKIELIEDIKALQERTGKVLTVEFKDTINIEEFQNIPGVQNVRYEDGAYIMAIKENLDSVIKTLSAHKIEKMNLQNYSLEELFLGYYKTHNMPGDEAQ